MYIAADGLTLLPICITYIYVHHVHFNINFLCTLRRRRYMVDFFFAHVCFFRHFVVDDDGTNNADTRREK